MNAGSENSYLQGRPLRVLQVLRAPVGGLFRHVCDLTFGLSQRGHAVGIVCHSGAVDTFWKQRLSEMEKYCALGVTRLPIGRLLRLADYFSIRKLYRLALKLDVDIIHGHGAKGGAYARLVGRMIRTRHPQKKIATLYTPHGGSLHYRKGTLSGLLYHSLERMLFPMSDRLLFESTYSRTRYGALINPQADAFPVIHNGLQDSEFKPVTLSDNATTLVYAGELRTLKGVGVLLDAMTKLPEHVTLTIVGSGAEEALFHQQADKLSLGWRVRFLSPRSVREALSLGQIAILPSLAESMPYLILEALAMRHPVIATRVGGIPEIFGPDESHLISPNNAQELADAITAALADMPAMQKTTDALSADVRRNFTLDNMVNRIINEYHQALNRNVRSES